MSSNVVVNLQVEASAAGSLSIFAAEKPPITNEIMAETMIPVAVFYTAGTGEGSEGEAGLWRFQQPSSNAAEITAEVELNAGGDAPAYAGFVNDDAGMTALQNSLTDVLYLKNPASETVKNPFEPETLATPFDDQRYAEISAYHSYASIGDLALALAAHEIFGHVQATAAIDNDALFVQYINDNDKDELDDEGANGEDATGANIAAQLAYAIASMDTTKATSIAKSVIGQDASRARVVDNTENPSESEQNLWQYLQFKPGDVVYVQVTLNKPSITFGNGIEDDANLDQQFDGSSPATYEHTYNIKLTLGATATSASAYEYDAEEPAPEEPAPITAISLGSTAVSQPVAANEGTVFTASVAGNLVLYAGETAGEPIALTAEGTHTATPGTTGYTWTPSA